MEEWVKAGIKVYSCYEAGACGYWYHRELIKRGAVNFVAAPRPLENQRRKHQKTDRLEWNCNSSRTVWDNMQNMTETLAEIGLPDTGRSPVPRCDR